MALGKRSRPAEAHGDALPLAIASYGLFPLFWSEPTPLGGETLAHLVAPHLLCIGETAETELTRISIFSLLLLRVR